MTTNAISGVLAPPTAIPTVSQPLKTAPPNDAASVSQAASALPGSSISGSKAASAPKKPEVAGVAGTKEAPRAMTHVVEVYNLQGKPRTRFLDSHNNLIYQIPSEAKAKMEDLMANSASSPDTVG